MLTLNNLKGPKGSHRNTKRIGRGAGSGQGTQAGKGHKGQKARSGGGVRTGFIGGAMPLYMRLPKRGFVGDTRKKYTVLSLDQINDRFNDSGEITKTALFEKKLLKNKARNRPVKILGGKTLSRALTFNGIEKFSQSAKDVIEKAGGSIIPPKAKT